MTGTATRPATTVRHAWPPPAPEPEPEPAEDGQHHGLSAGPLTKQVSAFGCAAPILADLRQLEIAVRATRISRMTPELINALGAVRRHYDELTTLGAGAPDAPLAQRLYAARHRANLSTLETAQAAGVTEEIIVRAETDQAIPAGAADAVERLISQIS